MMLDNDSDCAPVTLDLSMLASDSERMQAMISDVGLFLGAFLSQRHPCAVETHVALDQVKRARRVKHGAELHELLLEDHEAIFHHDICNGRLLKRMDAGRREAHDCTNNALVFTNIYTEFLFHLETLCAYRCRPTDVIEFRTMVIEPVEPVGAGEYTEQIVVGGYFNCIKVPCMDGSFRKSRISHDGVVKVGRFATALSTDLEYQVEAWIEALQYSVSEACEDCRGHVQYQTQPASIITFVKGVLVALISSHVAMDDCFDSRTSLLCRNITANNLEAILARVIHMAQPQFDAAVNNQKREMSILIGLCTTNNSSKLVEIVKQFGDSIVSGLGTVKRLRSADKSTYDFHVDNIIGIVRSVIKRSAFMRCDIVLAVQIEDWQRDVGPRALDALRRICESRVAALTNASFPATVGFTPTLRHLKGVPPPTWTFSLDVERRVKAAMAQLPPLNGRTSSTHDLNLSIETTLAIRMISVVWELSACQDTNDAYFTQGRVLASVARRVTSMHKVETCIAQTMLKIRLQHHLIGQNYRNALRSVAEFKGSDIEGTIRMAVQCVSRWSVQELMVVCSEGSPLFSSNLFKLMDATLSSMVNRPSLRSAAIIVRTLMSARPILISVRSESGIERGQPSSDTIDMLMSIPAIREWDGMGDELVLTHTDVCLGMHGTSDALRRMSSDRRVVSYSRRKGTKNVYTFNGRDLRRLVKPTAFRCRSQDAQPGALR
jgi:hypothetical protein